MTFSFNPQQGLIFVMAELAGPTGSIMVRLALDTAATYTVIAAGLLRAVRYDTAGAANWAQLTTGSGVAFVPIVPVDRLTALGQDRISFPVLAHTLPPGTSADGVLGLDFLRGHALSIDFRTGQIALT
jgi:hypothetical protein